MEIAASTKITVKYIIIMIFWGDWMFQRHIYLADKGRHETMSCHVRVHGIFIAETLQERLGMLARAAAYHTLAVNGISEWVSSYVLVPNLRVQFIF